MTTVFFVQPYRIKYGRLVASGALPFDDRLEAVAAGARTARFQSGVVVLAQEIDGRSGRHGRPQVIAIHGRVPEPWLAAPAAAVAA